MRPHLRSLMGHMWAQFHARYWFQIYNLVLFERCPSLSSASSFFAPMLPRTSLSWSATYVGEGGRPCVTPFTVKWCKCLVGVLLFYICTTSYCCMWNKRCGFPARALILSTYCTFIFALSGASVLLVWFRATNFAQREFGGHTSKRENFPFLLKSKQNFCLFDATEHNMDEQIPPAPADSSPSSSQGNKKK